MKQDSLKTIVQKLEMMEISVCDIPEQYATNKTIIKKERELGIRKIGKRGYDALRMQFFVEETLMFKNEWGDKETQED